MHAEMIWDHGTIKPWTHGVIHSMTPSLHYGLSVFEGIRFYQTEKGPAIFRMAEHWDRFFYSCKVLGMTLPFSRQQLTQGTIELIRESAMTEGYIRPIAFFTEQQVGLHNAGGPVGVHIGLFSWKKKRKDALRVCTSKYMRIHPQTTDPEAKISGHYVNTHLALMDATSAGYDDALMNDWRGFVAEASAANIFVVQNGVFLTPKRGSILNGITRQTIIELLRATGYQVHETDITRHTILERSHEVFICGTAYEVMPVININKRVIGTGYPGSFTKLVSELYMHIIHGLDANYTHWLTYV
jgi:branched-chain amino acid aminotransferase